MMSQAASGLLELHSHKVPGLAPYSLRRMDGLHRHLDVFFGVDLCWRLQYKMDANSRSDMKALLVIAVRGTGQSLKEYVNTIYDLIFHMP